MTPFLQGLTSILCVHVFCGVSYFMGLRILWSYVFFCGVTFEPGTLAVKAIR